MREVTPSNQRTRVAWPERVSEDTLEAVALAHFAQAFPHVSQMEIYRTRPLSDAHVSIWIYNVSPGDDGPYGMYYCNTYYEDAMRKEYAAEYGKPDVRCVDTRMTVPYGL